MTISNARPTLALTACGSYDPGVMAPRHGARETRVEREAGSLGERLTAARIAAKLSQSQLAKRLGVGIATVQRWEAGTNAPRGLQAKAVERFLAGK